MLPGTPPAVLDEIPTRFPVFPIDGQGLLLVITRIAVEVTAQASHLSFHVLGCRHVDTCFLVPFDQEVRAVDEHEHSRLHQHHCTEETGLRRQILHFHSVDDGISTSHQGDVDTVALDEDVLRACHSGRAALHVLRDHAERLVSRLGQHVFAVALVGVTKAVERVVMRIACC